jgi:hypothetical protein
MTDNQRCQFYANHAPDVAHAFAWYTVTPWSDEAASA